jgi:hypothetical protein
MDIVVLSWLNDTITVELQDIVRDQVDTARKTWLALEDQFVGTPLPTSPCMAQLPLTPTFACLAVPATPTLLPSLPISYLLAPLDASSLDTPLTTRGIAALTSFLIASSSIDTLFLTKMCFPLLAPPHPPISTLFSSPIQFHLHPRPSLAPLLASRAAPTPMPPLAPLPVPRAASTPPLAPRAATSTPLMPRVTPSTSVAYFTDLALVYHRHGHATPSAPADLGPSTSANRFGDPAIVYHCRDRAMPLAPDALLAPTEPPMYHPITIHCDPGHVHLMVTHRATDVLRPVDRLILATDTTATPPDVSPVPSSICAALADHH